MTNSARLSGRPSSSAAYNVGDVVDTPDSAIKSWRYLGAGEWEPNDAVRYTTGPGGGVLKLSADALTRRPVYPKNLVNPTQAYGVVQTLGTVTDAPGVTHTMIAAATESGATARILGSITLTLDTSKYYEISVRVDAVSLSNQAAMSKGWFGLSVAPTEGAQQLLFGVQNPVVGERVAIRIKPAAASTIVRMGIGINNGETVVTGDTMSFSDLCCYEIADITETVLDYSYSAYGVVGKSVDGPYLPGSCVIACGDSWSNDFAEWAGLLGVNYRREMIVRATGGHNLAQIKVNFDNAINEGDAARNRPSRHVPGVGVIVGGINDIIADTAPRTIAVRAQAMIDALRVRYIRPIFVVQPLATDSTHYTAARAEARAYLSGYLKAEGADVIDLRDHGFVNSDGTASATLMNSESLAWIHPSAAGSAELARLVDARIRDIDRAAQHIILPARWQI